MIMTQYRATPAVVILVAVLTLPVTHAESGNDKVFDVVVEGGKVVGDDKTLRVTESDRVTLRLTSDAPIEVHLHGYDIEKGVAPDAPAVMSFEAFATGRFPISVHGADGSESTLRYVEDYPR